MSNPRVRKSRSSADGSGHKLNLKTKTSSRDSSKPARSKVPLNKSGKVLQKVLKRNDVSSDRTIPSQKAQVRSIKTESHQKTRSSLSHSTLNKERHPLTTREYFHEIEDDMASVQAQEKLVLKQSHISNCVSETPSNTTSDDVIIDGLSTHMEASTTNSVLQGYNPDMSSPLKTEDVVVSPKALLTHDAGCFSVYSCNANVFLGGSAFRLEKKTSENELANLLTRKVTLVNTNRQVQRGKELLKLIELCMDDVRHLLDLQPLDDYSSYILRFGQSGHCQMQTQTLDDCVSRDVQTGDPRSAPYSSWTQAPPIYDNGYSGHDYHTASAPVLHPEDCTIDIDENLQSVLHKSYLEIAPLRKSSIRENTLTDFSAATLHRLKASMNTVLAVLEEDAEERCDGVFENRLAMKDNSVQISLSLSASTVFDIHERCYQT
uniref:AKAP_110 domain-containing protein n=1 Tax=Mesocestoides corti TaxID=53468 RepID=A0A5K3FAT1_MESCO